MPRDGRATRDQIVSVAMRRFVDDGYDKTSLREIAEEIGVTKAALYYHFRTKEDIVATAMTAYSGRVAELAAWVTEQTASRARDEELVDRMLGLVGSDGGMILRFGQANPTVVARADFGAVQIDVVRVVVHAIAGDDAPPEATLRATLAFAALMLGSIAETPLPIRGDQAERTAAARTVALDLLAPLSA